MNISNIISLLVIFIIIIIIYLVYRYLVTLSNKAYVTNSDDKVFITSPSNAMIMKTIDYKDLPKSINDTSYSLGLWFYIDGWDYKYQQLKHVLNKGDILNNQPTIYFDRTKNVLKIKVDVVDGLHEVIEVNDIYMKQWVYLYINFEDTNVNVFLNGKLVKSHILQSDIQTNTGDIYINKSGGFNGLVTKIMVSNDLKNQEDIAAIYKKGPYSSVFLDFSKKFFKNLSIKFGKILDVCNK